MTQAADDYMYVHNGRDGLFDVIEIISPEGETVGSLYYWDNPDEYARAEASAKTICEQLNRWRDPVSTAPNTGAYDYGDDDDDEL